MINYLLIGLFLNIAFPMVPAWVFVLAAIGLVTVLNVIGISSVAGMSNVIVGAQFVFAVVFVAMAVKPGRHPLAGPEPALRRRRQPAGLRPLMAGAAVLCLSFLGFDAVSTLAEETRDPQRDIPRAIVITTVGAGLLFTVLAVFSQLVFPGSVFQDAESAANEVMLAAGGKFLASFFTAAYVAGAAGSALASQASVSRILYSMGRDGILPRRVFGSLGALQDASDRDPGGLGDFPAGGGHRPHHPGLDDQLRRAGGVLRGEPGGDPQLPPARRPPRPRDLLRYGLVPAIGLSLTLWLWTSLSALTLVIGLTWFAAGLAYLALHTGGFRRKAPTVTFSEQN